MSYRGIERGLGKIRLLCVKIEKRRDIYIYLFIHWAACRREAVSFGEALPVTRSRFCWGDTACRRAAESVEGTLPVDAQQCLFEEHCL